MEEKFTCFSRATERIFPTEAYSQRTTSPGPGIISGTEAPFKEQLIPPTKPKFKTRRSLKRIISYFQRSYPNRTILVFGQERGKEIMILYLPGLQVDRQSTADRHFYVSITNNKLLLFSLMLGPPKALHHQKNCSISCQ